MKTDPRPKTPLPSDEETVQDRLYYYLCDPFLTVEECKNLAGIELKKKDEGIQPDNLTLFPLPT
jgi:hypothetical protein